MRVTRYYRIVDPLALRAEQDRLAALERDLARLTAWARGLAELIRDRDGSALKQAQTVAAGAQQLRRRVAAMKGR